ncbi:MAG TPA: Ig-like domain-containing protein [Acidimicrobiales bacterium]|nr:Ig-like domain-containing protein [Acidimicrobiales bacterium]
MTSRATPPAYGRSNPRWTVALVAVLVLVAGQPLVAAPVSAAEIAGWNEGPSYRPISAPSGQKPQSKLWFAQSSWWGVLFSSPTGDYTIHRFDWPTSTWVDTGVFVDNRDASNSDALWDGSHLYVATAVTPGRSASDYRALLRRYRYEAGSYHLDAGFPETIANVAMEAVVIDRDTTGKIWVTWTAPNSSGGRQVFVTHTNTSDGTLVAPFVLPVAGASNLISDDISAVVAFRSQIGVMWSNQNDDTIYFAVHRDGDPDGTWQLSRALQGPRNADDHINVKSLQVDESGQVFAGVKTELTGSDAPLILLLVLRLDGTWTRHTFGTVADDHTRPLVLIDGESRELYMFAVTPCCNGGTVYMKKTTLDNISFGPGRGTPFIGNEGDSRMNNPTSTKQTLNSRTGLLVLASDDRVKRYGSGALALSSSLDTVINSGPPSVTSTPDASFTFSSPNGDAGFECALDQAAFAACTSPATYGGLGDGPHTFQVRAVDPAGPVDPTPASRTWTIDTAAPGIIARSPAPGAAAVGVASAVQAGFSEPMNPTTLDSTTFSLAPTGTPAAVEATVAYDTTSRTATLRPTGPLEVATSYTVTVKGGAGGVLDSAGTAMGADATWSFTTVDSDTRPPQTILADSGPSGTVDTSSAVFDYASDEPGSSFECRLDAAAFAPCTSPSSYTSLADGNHTFEVRAVDAAGNVDPTPASRSWTVAATVLADGFESGDFSQWSAVGTQTTGSATVQQNVVHTGAHAALLSATTAVDSLAFIRSDLAIAHTELILGAQLRMVDEGRAGRLVPIVKLADARGTLVTVFRENVTGGLSIRYDGAHYPAAGALALGTWTAMELRVATAGPGQSMAELSIGGQVVYRTTQADLATYGISAVQLGSDHRRQPFALAVDEVVIRG